MKTLISTDTSCMVQNDALKKYNISVFPLNVIIDGEEYLDGVTITQPELYEAMRAGKSIKTSTPPLGEIIEYFNKLFSDGYEHIIHFTISSKLSSMNSLFNKVAEEHFKGKLTVIDSYCLSSVMLSYVFYAYDEAEKGTSPADIASAIEKMKEKNYLVFVPENLNALKNGGRISPTIALIGNVIGIKPVIELKDGALEKDEMTRKVRAALTERITAATETYPASDFDFSVINFFANEILVDYIVGFTNGLIGEDKTITGIIPINVCAHCGPGTIGVTVSPKINGKSLKDFL